MSVCGTVCCCLKLRGFSWKRGIEHFSPRGTSSSHLGIEPPDLPGGPSYLLKPDFSGCCSLLRHPIAATPGTGILTRFPSTTPFGLALGADSPYADERCVGNLGFTACEFFTRINVTHVSIRTSDTSSTPRSAPSQAYRTLPYHPPLRMDPQLRLMA